MKRIVFLLATVMISSLWSTASFAFWDDFFGSFEKRAIGGARNTYVSRIIGGCRVGDECNTEEQWKTVVALFYKNRGRMHQFCGGNLLHQQWVVTAAHCMFTADGSPLQAADIGILADTIHLHKDQEGYEVSVKKTFVHKQYDHDANTPYNDIALLELSRPIEQPTMGVYLETPNVGTNATVVGWGARNPDLNGDADYPNTLHQVELPIASLNACNSEEAYGGDIINKQLCAGYPQGGQDSCVGDSGGPLMIKENGIWQQVGVVSFGEGCAQSNKYGVYTRLSAYAEWMYNTSGGIGSWSIGLSFGLFFLLISRRLFLRRCC